MLRKIWQLLQPEPNNPYQGYLGEIWEIWARNVAHAVLLARWSWKKLPEEIVGQAAALRQQADSAARHAQINDQVQLQLRSLGISSGFSGGGFFGFNPEQALFISVMAMIRQHSGDPPPASDDAVAVAELVLTGQRQPHEALIAAAPPFARQQLAALIPVVRLIGLEKLFLVSSYVQAAFALPRDRILALLPESDRQRLQVQGIYDIIRSAPLDQTIRAKLQAAYLGFVADLIDKGAIANFGITKDHILQNQPYDDVVRRLIELGWLTDAV